MFWVRQVKCSLGSSRGWLPVLAADDLWTQEGVTEREREELKTWSRPGSVWRRIICQDSGGEYFLRSKRLKWWLHSEVKTRRHSGHRLQMCCSLFVVAAPQRLASLARHLNVAHSRCREFITDNLVVKIFCKLHTSVISYLSQVICLLRWQAHELGENSSVN